MFPFVLFAFSIKILTDTSFSYFLGAHFGTTFPHLLFQSFPELVPRAPTKIYVPRIFGFRVSERAKSGPRMQWLRLRPATENAEDEEEEEEDAPADANEGGSDADEDGAPDQRRGGAGAGGDKESRDSIESHRGNSRQQSGGGSNAGTGGADSRDAMEEAVEQAPVREAKPHGEVQCVTSASVR